MPPLNRSGAEPPHDRAGAGPLPTEPAAGESVAAEPAAGESVIAGSVAGKSVVGEPDPGGSVAGESVAGESVAGVSPREVDPAELRTLAGDARSAPCGLLAAAPDGTVLRVNDTFLHWTGWSADQVVGRSVEDLLTPGSRTVYQRRVRPALDDTGEIGEVVLVLQCPERQRPVLAVATLRADDGGSPVLRLAVVDASGRQELEHQLLAARRALARSQDRLLVLQQASETFGDARTAESLIGLLADATRTAFEATISTVMMQDPAAGALRAVGASSPLGETASADSDRPEAIAVRTGAVVRISVDDDGASEVAVALRRSALHSMVVTPLLDDHAAFGALACFFAGPTDLDEEDVDLLKALARQAALGLLRIRLQEQLRFQAMHDQLTGLANRQLLQYRLAQALSRSGRQQHSMAVIFLDLDGFKPINDDLGHLVGDGVLEQVSTRLRQSVRASDTAARFGGDEFVVLCEDTDAAAAVSVAERIRSEIRRPLAGAAADFPLTASVGVVVYHPSGGPAPAPNVILGHADAAMYRSKAAGKDRETVIEI
jgi:diguanylate cyclase (GGDEF)-like protein/PAS domain S-box-containing protein